MRIPIRTGVLLGAALWCFALAAAPLFHAGWIYQFFSLICHQQPDRTWHIAGEPVAACIRCASVYLGFFAGLLLLHAPNARWLKIAIAITAAEWLAARFVVDEAVLRALAGILLGSAAAPVVRTGIEEMFRRTTHDL